MKLRDATTPVLVFRTVADHYGHAGLGIARSLGRLGVSIYWLDADPGALAARSRYVRRAFALDVDSRHSDHVVERILSVGRELPGAAILMPTDDAGCLFVAERADALRDLFVFPRESAELRRRLADKQAVHVLCRELGLPTPATRSATSREEVAAFLEEASLPVVFKPAKGWSAAGGTSVVIVDSIEAGLRACETSDVSHERPLLLQEYVPGPPASVWMFNGYFDEKSECRLGFTGHKIRQYPPYTGLTTLGVCRANETVERHTRRLMEAVGYRGILDIGYRYDARDGTYKLLDVNPRIGATFRLFVAENGMDVARALYCDLTNQDFEAAPAAEGRRWVVENLDVRSAAVYMRRGELGLWAWLRSYRGVAEAAWWASDDPRPFWEMVAKFVARDVLRARTRHRLVRATAADRQRRVDQHFASASEFWSEIYDRSDVYAVIHQERRRRALAWIARLGLAPGTRVLDVGCGGGATAIALARSGYDVDATDAVTEMLERTRRRAGESGVTLRVSFADAHELPFEDGAFDVVVALGVIPWLHSPARALHEFARVVKPGGYVIVNADNRDRLTRLLDPTYSPALTGVRAIWRRARGGAPPPELPVTMHGRKEFHALLDSAALNVRDSTALGFGPFVFRWRRLPERIEVPLHQFLQRLADRGIPPLRQTAAQYLVLAQRRG